MKLRTVLLASTAAIGFGWCDPGALAATVGINVGPEGQYQTIGHAVTAANGDTDLSNHYVINVAPGTYLNDFATVMRPMTIRSDPAFPGQRAILKATTPLPNEKGIILTFASLHVRGLVFEGARIDNSLGGNGAGIRDQQSGPSARLVVEHSIFRNNQEGILQGNDLDETITIVNSRFINNGNPDINYFQHAVYINSAASLSVTNSLFCGQLIGHNVKSRAMMTIVSNNQIYDGAAGPSPCRVGSSSFAIDIANGGLATIAGNHLIQGPASQNYKIIDYGEEGLSYPDNSLVVTDNNFVNTAPSATGIYDPNCIPVQTSGNTFTAVNTPVDPPQCEAPLAD
jgi:hypothetical protein